LAVGRRLGDKQHVAVVIANLGEAWQQRGDLALAAALYREALPLFEELEDKWQTAFTLSGLGNVELARGDAEQAMAFLTESLLLWHEVGDKAAMAGCLEGLAKAAVSSDQAAHAASLLGAAEALRQAIGAPLPVAYRADYDRYVAAVRAGLDEAGFAAAWAEGRAIPFDHLIALTTRSAAEPSAAQDVSPRVAVDGANRATG
jgi:tetratricopeptide (TPR) repeat protein